MANVKNDPTGLTKVQQKILRDAVRVAIRRKFVRLKDIVSSLKTKESYVKGVLKGTNPMTKKVANTFRSALTKSEKLAA